MPPEKKDALTKYRRRRPRRPGWQYFQKVICDLTGRGEILAKLAFQIANDEMASNKDRLDAMKFLADFGGLAEPKHVTVSGPEGGVIPHGHVHAHVAAPTGFMGLPMTRAQGALPVEAYDPRKMTDGELATLDGILADVARRVAFPPPAEDAEDAETVDEPDRT